MADRPGRVWRIGQLATATGLTVRALHHYDHVGLVRPSGRTPAGHRLYDESDVQRLYQVLALRQLGLSLDAIGKVLDGASSIQALLTQLRACLDRQLVAMRTLRAQLGTMIAAIQGAKAVSVTDFSRATIDLIISWLFSPILCMSPVRRGK